MHHEAGKGDKRRPTDEKAFSENYLNTFGDKKATRGSFVWDSEQGKFVDKAEYKPKSTVSSHMVIGDLQPYQSMVDGSMIDGRKQHREHLKRNGVMEVGNETKHLKAYGDYTPNKKEIRQELIKNVQRIKAEQRRKR